MNMRSDHYAVTRPSPDCGLLRQQARRVVAGVRAPTAAPGDVSIRGATPSQPRPFTVARDLGRDIDGAWWPRADRITNELPGLVAVLTPLLGEINSINVNWSPLQRPSDFNWPGWEHKRQHVMTVSGAHAPPRTC